MDIVFFIPILRIGAANLILNYFLNLQQLLC